MNFIPQTAGVGCEISERILVPEIPTKQGKVLSRMEFRSNVFEAYPGEKKSTVFNVHRKRALSFLCRKFHEGGYEIIGVEYALWGWRIGLARDGVRFWVGFGSYGAWSDRFLCVVEHPEPTVRRWFRRIPTSGVMDKFFADFEAMMNSSEEIIEFYWCEGEDRAAA
ncbi:hypothetical protein [Erythrobacter aureus]|uniref:Uncharacterized protein n=1 Tax=Erythrobacter aureus TaxID=2182384 RepID=A0A345YIF1_9SPHN|nr:hypothetical protein [Erythrobacter aureus]AXK43703.1 hypothetical protein DVR09_14685 [Erythrobacter aureus]